MTSDEIQWLQNVLGHLAEMKERIRKEENISH